MKNTIILLAVLVASFSASAQDDMNVGDEQNFAISFSPQHLITGGMRMDIDFPVTEKTWLTIAPTLYYVDNTSMWDAEYTSYTGVGVLANYRYFPSSEGIYAGLGLNYRHLNTDYTVWNEDIERSTKFNTYGFDLTFGYQFILVDQLFMDLYLGWGFRYSTEEIEDEDINWNDAILDLAYSGFLPVAGLRLGFEF